MTVVKIVDRILGVGTRSFYARLFLFYIAFYTLTAYLIFFGVES
jgi:hypothetical protein